MTTRREKINYPVISTPIVSQQISNIRRIVLILLIIQFCSCSDFVEIDPPKNILVAETVFDNAATVESALANIYYKMREQSIVSGNFGVTTGLGIYSDELDYYGFDTDYSQLYTHNVLPSNNVITTWWNEAYYLIYAANDVLKGVENATDLTEEEKNTYKGQALVVRSYMHSLLVSLYGDVPYITVTDYTENNTTERLPETTVKEAIISDLVLAVAMLSHEEIDSEQRVVPDVWAAKALLSRMYLMTEQWEQSETISSELIENFSLTSDLSQVFLKESTETIWQLKDGDNPKNTQIANQLIINFIPGQTYSLTDSFSEAFESGDLRKTYWTDTISDTDQSITLRFANKYKATFIEAESLEYSILFRLAEQYLIRAEARVQSGNISGAIQDLNSIRNRAGLPDFIFSTSENLIDAILQERRVELFTEQGLRWFDLKRTGNAGSVLGTVKANWTETDVLFPIPENEVEINPNLLPQNPGY